MLKRLSFSFAAAITETFNEFLLKVNWCSNRVIGTEFLNRRYIRGFIDSFALTHKIIENIIKKIFLFKKVCTFSLIFINQLEMKYF